MVDSNRALAETIEHLARTCAELMREREGTLGLRDDVRSDEGDLSALIASVGSILGWGEDEDIRDAAARVVKERDELLADKADLKKLKVNVDLAKDVLGAEAGEFLFEASARVAAERDDWAARHDKAQSVISDYRKRLGALDSALDAEAVVQDYTERVRALWVDRVASRDLAIRDSKEGDKRKDERIAELERDRHGLKVERDNARAAHKENLEEIARLQDHKRWGEEAREALGGDVGGLAMIAARIVSERDEAREALEGAQRDAARRRDERSTCAAEVGALQSELTQAHEEIARLRGMIGAPVDEVAGE